MTGSSSSVGFRGVTLVTGGGAANWTDLNDTPASITANKAVVANAGGTALDFSTNDLSAYALDTDLSNYLRHDGSVAVTGALNPVNDAGINLGSNAYSWRQITGRRANFVDGNATRGGQGLNSVIGGLITGAGNGTLGMGAGSFPPIGLFGNIYAYYANDTVTMQLDGGGSFMVGSAFTYYNGNNTAEILCDANSFGSFTGGYAYTGFAAGGSTARLRNRSAGGFCWGYTNPNGANTHIIQVNSASQGAFCAGRTTGAGTATIQAGTSAPGSFCQGYISASNATGIGLLNTTGDGAFAQGAILANLGSNTATILASGNGAFAQGRARENGTIRATGNGSFAQGYARTAGGPIIEATTGGAFVQGRCVNTGLLSSRGVGAFAQGNVGAGSIIEATGAGSFAHGNSADGYYIRATATGAFAAGDANAGNIDATAINAFQLGIGVNATADSLQVGADFLAKANGQHAGAFDSFTLAAAATTFVCTANDMIITGDAGTNTIATITGGIDGQFLCLLFVDANVTITDDNTHAADSIDLSAAFTSADDTVLLLKHSGGSWYEVSRSVN